ncbi:MAG: Swt1 family HEPN domain-containing protein [Patescibacteria group bacterium]
MTDRTDNKIAGFVLKGQMATQAIENLGAHEQKGGKLTFEDVGIKVSLKSLSPDKVEAATKMAAVYIAIASFENMTRELISNRLLEEKGANWWESCVSADIQKRARTRREEEEKIRWHKARGLSPIFFAELNDLILIIQQNWGCFEDLFHNLDWARQIIKTLERSRNVIMHSGDLSVEDIERVGMNIRDWVRQIGA